MGRPRKNEICPKCKKPGYLEKNLLRVIHYNSFTKKRDKPCYVAQIIWEKQHKDWILQKNNEFKKKSPTEIRDFYWKLSRQSRQNLGFDRREKKAMKEILECIAIYRKIPLPIYKKESAPVPPEHLQGESGLYHKVGDLSKRFFKIGRELKKIQKRVYQFRPDEKISSECVKDLNDFETSLLIPLEKLLVPYSNKEFTANWTEWIKIQLDSILLGPNHTGKLHGMETGEFELKTNKEGKTSFREIKGRISSKQIKKNEKKVMEFSHRITRAHYIEKALTKWSYNTNIMEEYDENGHPITEKEDLTVSNNLKSIKN
jgi:hypothetical protein